MLLGLWQKFGGFRPPGVVYLRIALIAAIALLYTTPWDNYVIAIGAWTYPPDAVVGTIGLVPIEEYCFFVLQPLATGLLFEVERSGAITRSGARSASPAGVAAGAGLTIAGIAALVSGFSEYLGLILVWAGPVVIVQWLYDGRLLAQTTASWAIPLAASTCYLWIADAIAIRIGVWSISDAHTSGLHVVGLPIEEMTFFLLTNSMVLFGLVLLEAGGIPVTSRKGRQP